MNTEGKGVSSDKEKELQKIIDSMQHPFYVIDINNYRVRLANTSCGFGELGQDSTCHILTHKSSAPCGFPHVCPLQEVKKTKKAVQTEHIHYNKEGNERIMEVHGDPVFDDEGNLVMMIEYAFDITDRKKFEEELKKKVEEVEKFNKVMMGREKRIIELKKEINDLLKSLGKTPKYENE